MWLLFSMHAYVCNDDIYANVNSFRKKMITFVYYKHLFTTASDDLLNRTVCTGTPILKTASFSSN